MKNLKRFSLFAIAVVLSLNFIVSCELFEGNFEEIDLYGSWDIDNVIADVEIKGDNALKVMLARLAFKVVEDEMNEEMNHQLDSLGGILTFNEDYTFKMTFIDDTSSGTWFLEDDRHTLSISGDSTSIASMNIEKLNSESLELTWYSEEAEIDTSDSIDESFIVRLKIEAKLSKN